MAFSDWLPYSLLMQSHIKAQREPLSLSQIRDDAKRYGNKPPGTAFDKFYPNQAQYKEGLVHVP